MTALAHDLASLWPAVQDTAKRHGFLAPDLRPGWVSSTPEEAMPEAAVLAAVHADLGWARFRSAAWDGSGPEPDPTERGELLWAEWRDIGDESVSFRLWPNPAAPSASLVRRFREGEGQGAAPCLIEHVTLMGRSQGYEARYDVIWGAPMGKPFEMRRLFARFVGFSRST
jgi:hypothetical protein